MERELELLRPGSSGSAIAVVKQEADGELAVELLREAQRVRRADTTLDPTDRAETEFSLAKAIVDGSPEEAIELARFALEAYDAESWPRENAEVAQWLAEHAP